MKKITLFKLAILIFASAFVMGCSPNEKNIEAVKNGTLGGHGQTTVGRAFESVLGNAKWTYFETNKGVRVVELSGLPGTQFLPTHLYKTFCNNRSQYEVKIQFSLHMTDDLFEISYCGFGENNSFDCDEFIEYAYGNNSSYSPINCDAFGSFTDARDGQTYETLKIGNLVWMAKNLNYKTQDSYCYEDKAEKCDVYGRLYTWDAAKKACPEGWHLPSYEEFEAFLESIGGKEKAGVGLKSTTGWNREGNGADSYGFTVLPAGFRKNNGNYDGEGNYANFWSSYDYDNGFYVSYMYLDCYHDYARLSDSKKNDGLSVRCVQD